MSLPKLVPLSVAENKYKSNEMAARVSLYCWPSQTYNVDMVFDELGRIKIRKDEYEQGKLTEINIAAVDIDSMILFLQEAKNFIAEAATFRTLLGK